MRKWNLFYLDRSRCFKIEIITWVSNNNDHVQSEFISNEWAESITIYRKEYNILCPSTKHHSVANTQILYIRIFAFHPKSERRRYYICAWSISPYGGPFIVSMFSGRNDFHFVVLECNIRCENLIGQMWLRRMMEFFMLFFILCLSFWHERSDISKFRWKFYWTANNWSRLPNFKTLWSA